MINYYHPLNPNIHVKVKNPNFEILWNFFLLLSLLLQKHLPNRVTIVNLALRLSGLSFLLNKNGGPHTQCLGPQAAQLAPCGHK